MTVSTNYLYKSIDINNFRAFKNLNISKLKRINIIGGFNGTGKSTLLEAIFLSLDTSSSAALTKAYSWRQVPITEAEELFYIFNDRKDNATIKSTLEIGALEINFTRHEVPQSAISLLTSSMQKSIPEMTSAPAIDKNGICTRVKLDNRERIVGFTMFTVGGIAAMLEKADSIPVPMSIILGSLVKSPVEEVSQRLSSIIKLGKIETLLEPMRLIQKDLRNFTMLQTSSGLSIYATIGDELVPINILGEGFVTLFSVILAISQAKNGVVLLDEVDTSLHYSVTAQAWEAISKAAISQNCQIFATSHSREGILNAAAGIKAAGRDKDFQFIRLERHESNHKAVLYNMDDLMAAEEFNFEFR